MYNRRSHLTLITNATHDRTAIRKTKNENSKLISYHPRSPAG